MVKVRFNMITKIALLFIAAAAPSTLFGFINGADAGYSGAPGEQSCAYCHSTTGGFGNVQVLLTNGPFYSPGVKQHITITINDTPAQSWGFQMSARQANSTSTQAGTFIVGSDGNTQTVCIDTAFTLKKQTFNTACTSSVPLQFIEQTRQGARVGAVKRTASFDFDWTPPTNDVGDINLYVSTVGADGSDSGAGHVYNTKITLPVLRPNQPILTSNSVVNGASFQPAIASSSWVTITGKNLAQSTRSWGDSDFVGGKLPTSLDGVSVSIDNKPAYVAYISPTQLNVLAPPDASLATVNATVANNGLTSNISTVTVQSSAPAPFLWSGKYAVATRSDYSLAAPSSLFPTATPAKRGEVIILWSTGLGLTNPSVSFGIFTPSDKLYPALVTPKVLIGGISAQVIGAALAPGYAGLFQIAITIPDGVSSGDQLLQIQSGSNISPLGSVITIQ